MTKSNLEWEAKRRADIRALEDIFGRDFLQHSPSQEGVRWRHLMDYENEPAHADRAAR